MSFVYWTPEEDAILRRYYRISADLACQHLPRRTRLAVRYRAKKLRILQYQLWELWEIELVRHCYPDGGWRAVQRWLPYRDKASISNLASRNRINGKNQSKVAPTLCVRHGGSHTQPLGARRLGQNGYVYVKISDKRGAPSNRKWKAEHRLVYEQHHGIKLDRHTQVVHINGNRADNRIENLRTITPRQQAQLMRSSMNRYPPELRKTMYALRDFKNQLKPKGITR